MSKNKQDSNKEQRKAWLMEIAVTDLEIQTGFMNALQNSGLRTVWDLVVFLKGRPDGMYSALLQKDRIGELGAVTILHRLVAIGAIKPKHLNCIPVEVKIRHQNEFALA